MNDKPGRRKFIKNIGLSSIAAGMIPSSLLANDSNKNFDTYDKAKEDRSLANNKSYSGDYLNRIAFPIGGMGAGMFCIEGSGAVSNMSVRNKPDVFNEPQFFAALSIKGINNGSKILEGRVPDCKKFGQHGSANGSGSATTGLPRFHKAVFKSQFPFSLKTMPSSSSIFC